MGPTWQAGQGSQLDQNYTNKDYATSPKKGSGNDYVCFNERNNEN
jgi:hypothetical protein